MLGRFYVNVTGCVGITDRWRIGYLSEAFFVISLKENIAFVKLFEISFGSNIITSFTEFQFRGTDTFGFIWVQTFEIHIQGNFFT